MKRLSLGCLFVLLVGVFSSGATAADYLTEADGLFDQGGLENLKQAIGLYLKAVEENPKNY